MKSPAKFCPRCKIPLGLILLGATQLDECSGCKGVWTDLETLNSIRTNSLKLAEVDALAAPKNKPTQYVPEMNPVRYLPCPVCATLMNRLNFGKISGVIVDVCREHGTWFDPGELQHVVEFIRTGGMDESRRREQAALASQESARKIAASGSIGSIQYSGGASSFVRTDDWLQLLADAAELLIRHIR